MNRELKNEMSKGLFMASAATFGLQLFRARKNPAGFRLSPWTIGLGAIATALRALPLPRGTYRGKSVVITGGSRGLGFTMAQQLAAEGAKVTILARDPDELDRACDELRRISDTVLTLVCDVTDIDHFDRALAEVRARYGTVDVLIHNAGAISVGPFNSMDDEDFAAQMRLHFEVAVQAMRVARPYFHLSGGGRVLFISSIGGRIPMPHMTPYCASKFALGGFAETIRTELAKENISVTVAYPGLMRTGSPIQAVFKGDSEREFTWFAIGDLLPGLSMSPETAARRMLTAAIDGRASIVVGVPAKLADWFHHSFPETYSLLATALASALPESRSHHRQTGAESRGLFSRLPWLRPFQAAARVSERRHNQASKSDAEFNMGLHNHELH